MRCPQISPHHSHPLGPPRSPVACLGRKSTMLIFGPTVQLQFPGASSWKGKMQRKEIFFLWLWVLMIIILFLMVEYAWGRIKKEGNSILTKRFCFQRAIQNCFHIPVVHVDTAITRDISNPNWRECKSISPEEDLPGHFWSLWSPEGQYKPCRLSLNWSHSGQFSSSKVFRVKFVVSKTWEDFTAALNN